MNRINVFIKEMPQISLALMRAKQGGANSELERGSSLDYVSAMITDFQLPEL